MKVYHFSPTLSTPFYPYPHSLAPFSPNYLSTCTLSCPTLFPTVSAALHSPTSLSHSLFYPNNPTVLPHSLIPIFHSPLSPQSHTQLPFSLTLSPQSLPLLSALSSLILLFLQSFSLIPLSSFHPTLLFSLNLLAITNSI